MLGLARRAGPFVVEIHNIIGGGCEASKVGGRDGIFKIFLYLYFVTLGLGRGLGLCSRWLLIERRS